MAGSSKKLLPKPRNYVRKDLEIVVCFWLDHYSFALDWNQPDAIVELMNEQIVCVTTGFLMAETEDSYVIMQTITTNEDSNTGIKILKPCVLQFQRLQKLSHLLTRRAGGREVQAAIGHVMQSLQSGSPTKAKRTSSMRGQTAARRTSSRSKSSQ